MKNHFNLRCIFVNLLFLLLTSPIFSNILAPQLKTTLYDHMVEVNKEWLQVDADFGELFELTFFANDEQRIQKHLQLVEQILRQKECTELSVPQKENRLTQLAVLRTYWQAARFPINTQHKHRQPYFVDDFGTACAVGYLVQQSGEEALVNRIKAENNFAYLREMDYPALGKWAKENGFTLEELAWIQPGYFPWHPPRWHGPGDSGGANGIIEKLLTDNENELLYIAGEFSEMDGVSANSVIAWDGDDWHTLGDGLRGVVNDMVLASNGDLYVSGRFDVDSEETNIAYWDGFTWTALQKGNMEGEIAGMIFYEDRLYIGGDFQKVDGELMPYLAYYDNGAWVNHGMEGGNILSNAFSVNERVTCFELVDGELAVGGYFTLTAPMAADPAHKVESNYLAFWDGDNWTHALGGDHMALNTMNYHDGSLYVGGEFDRDILCAVYTESEWHYLHSDTMLGYPILPFGDSLIHDFVFYNEQMYMLGGFEYVPPVGFSGRTIITVSPMAYGSGIDYFDNDIRAGEVFGDKFFVAGDFTEKNGLAYFIYGGGVGTIDPDDPPQLKIGQSAHELLLSYQNLDKAADFRIFNVQGQLLSTTRLPNGQGEIRLSTAGLASGTYVYQLANQAYREAGKLMVFASQF